jgi:hypothetical protein
VLCILEREPGQFAYGVAMEIATVRIGCVRPDTRRFEHGQWRLVRIAKVEQ